MRLNYRDARPIYMQIMDQLRQQILTGVLREGDRLPSVRELATELTINPNTIQRAYRELELQGWICSVPGKGSFVCGLQEAGAARQAQLLEQLDRLAEELEALGCSRAQLAARIQRKEEAHD